MLGSRSFRILILSLFLGQLVYANIPEGPVNKGEGGIVATDDKQKTSVWKNMRLYYGKVQEFAKTYINALNSVSDLLYGTYAMLKKWEDVSQKAVWLATNNPFDGSGLVDRIENAEGWFRESDRLFYVGIPTAMASSKNLSTQSKETVAQLRNLGKATTNIAKGYAESYQKAYLQNRSIKKNPVKDNVVIMSIEEEAVQNQIRQNAAAMAELHQQTLILQQEDAINQAVGKDVYEMVNCADEKVCGGMATRSDAESRMGMLDQRRAMLARMLGEQSANVVLQEVLKRTQIYVTQGVTVTAFLGPLIEFQKQLCEYNGLSNRKTLMTSYQWNNLYPTAYQYDGIRYVPNVHFYDDYN